jgi:hypothetical protein
MLLEHNDPVPKNRAQDAFEPPGAERMNTDRGEVRVQDEGGIIRDIHDRLLSGLLLFSGS